VIIRAKFLFRLIEGLGGYGCPKFGVSIDFDCRPYNSVTVLHCDVCMLVCGVWTGREPDAKVIKEMLAECPEKLNFTHFLTLFGEKLHGKWPPTPFSIFLHATNCSPRNSCISIHTDSVYRQPTVHCPKGTTFWL